MILLFEAKVRYTKIDNDGRERNVSESFLFDAVSYTEAEANVYQAMEQMVKGDFRIVNIKQSNIEEVIPHETGEWWYKAKISIITIDERAGREKRINQYILVMADDIQEALERLEEGLEYMIIPYTITAIQLSPIVDVFTNSKDEEDANPNLNPLQ